MAGDLKSTSRVEFMDSEGFANRNHNNTNINVKSVGDNGTFRNGKHFSHHRSSQASSLACD